MTLEKFINEHNIKGTFHSKVPNKTMKKSLNTFKYIEAAIYWYDDTEYPDYNNWFDVEGIGYGWIWLRNIKSKRLQRKKVIKYAMRLYGYGKNNKYYRSINDDITELWLEDDNAIYSIRCSNNELCPF